MGSSAQSLRPGRSVITYYLAATTASLPAQRATVQQLHHLPYQTPPPPLAPPLHRTTTTASTTPRTHHRSAHCTFVCPPATPPRRQVTPPSPQSAPRFHVLDVLTCKVRQAADSLRSSTLCCQTPPTISITPPRWSRAYLYHPRGFVSIPHQPTPNTTATNRPKCLVHPTHIA